jgi:ABC-type uncharacterized transport system YnjBCD substrate-binding protein
MVISSSAFNAEQQANKSNSDIDLMWINGETFSSTKTN